VARRRRFIPRPPKLRSSWPAFGRRDLPGVIFVIAIVAIVLFLAVRFPNFNARKAALGPDWDCTSLGQGEPICIKKPPQPAENPSPAGESPPR
jgi:hypothetical protein